MKQQGSSESFGWKLGEILVQNGWITWEQLEEALNIQKQASKNLHRMLDQKSEMTNPSQVLNLGEILIQHGWIDWKQLQVALEIQKETGKLTGEILLEHNLVAKENLYRAIAIQQNRVFVDFSQIRIPKEAIEKIPYTVAKRAGFIPLLIQDQTIFIAISDTRDFRHEKEILEILPGYTIRHAIASPEAILRAIEMYYNYR